MLNETSTSEQTSNTTKKKGLNPLLIMFFVFGLPYALAWYFLYSGNPIDFEAPSNNGVIVSPMIPLEPYALQLVNGEQINSASLAGNWLIFTTTPKCEAACKQTLLIMRQTRKAMAVDRDVITPILLLQDDKALHNLDIDLEKDFHILNIATSESSKTSGLLDIFSSQIPNIENSIFMVDPFGNLMMVYPAGTEQLGLLDDLKRLLKVNPAQR